MYEIQYSTQSIEDLRFLRKADQQTLLTGIETQLRYEPTIVTRNRKPMRSNPIAN
jgi:hypothetical protein